MNKASVQRWSLLLLVIFISALFFAMIRQFLMAIFLAGLFAALAHPLYRRLLAWCRGRRALASIATLAAVTLVVLLPLSGLVGVIATQAVKVGNDVAPWLQRQMTEPDALAGFIARLPLHDRIKPYHDDILKKAGDMVGKVSGFLIDGLSAATLGTAHFIFMTVTMLYTMFYFLMDGEQLLRRILYYLPLEGEDERLLLDKFISVARATLKGTAVIGVLQGSLAGLAFVVTGVPNAAFWGAIMALLSIVPGVGTALVWGPAALILALNGQIVGAIGLTVFCAAVVGALDNVLRPVLVGKDTQMHELMIFFSTLGGILMFGIVGLMLGPIIAALFTAIWELYGLAFQDVLPPVVMTEADAPSTTRDQHS